MEEDSVLYWKKLLQAQIQYFILTTEWQDAYFSPPEARCVW